MRPVRCAIYTRKSSEEGLEQGFNSLDAQREACAAYILSQASEGWSAMPDIYDDGGISGGTLERPALQRLLGDIAAGRVDIIVVYKVDRLTRSLLDFAKLVEAFDKAGVSFVSITQSFNTTTSMGRLTLNMLLSFAQFEREVTAERIRDKIAASKAKGMWMGGIPPLGYRPDGRSLAIVEEQANIVRDIYQRYLAIGNVRLLAEQLRADRIIAPLRTTTTGKTIGGRPFTRGQLYGMLRSRIYLGEIQHRDTAHPGLHDPIIDRDTWDAVQAKRADNLQGQRAPARVRHPSLLAGLVTDADGAPLVATHANKAVPGNGEGGKVRYRYYVSEPLHGARSHTGWRIPAREIESAVTGRLALAFDDPLALMAELGVPIDPSIITLAQVRGSETAGGIRRGDRLLIARLIREVIVNTAHMEIICDAAAVTSMLGVDTASLARDSLTLRYDVRLTRSGTAIRLVHDNGSKAASAPDPGLVRMIAQGHRYWRILRSEDIEVAALARREGKSKSWVSRMLRLAFLSPAATEALLDGRQHATVDVATLKAPGAVDAMWSAQARRFLPEG